MNHSTESCHNLINHVKDKQYFSKNPAIKKILTENLSSASSRRTYSKRNTHQNKYAHRISKHVNKVEEDETSVPEEETESNKEQEDEVSNNRDDVHIDEDQYIYDSDYDAFEKNPLQMC
eukprot:5879579-Ditylum_brightwellii.AAC.1